VTDRGLTALPMLDDAQIVAARGPRNTVDPFLPYHMLVEPEPAADGRVEDVATVFLSNQECPYRCLMCDLWKNTTTQKVPEGAIVAQIRYAIAQLGTTKHIKLYNSGNFFDPQAIPVADRHQICDLLHDYETVIVENHPQMCRAACLEFADRLRPQLEVAMGLETSHEPTLSRLNKRMTTADFAAACDRLTDAGIRIRTFILLRPPGTTEEQGIDRAIESVRFAFDHGVSCCAVIPTRAGNGTMERLQHEGLFEPPQLSSLERVFEQTLSWRRGRVFVDLWDIAAFARCGKCVEKRVARLHQMNLTQCEQPPVACSDCGGTAATGAD